MEWTLACRGPVMGLATVTLPVVGLRCDIFCGCGVLLLSDYIVGVGTFRGVWCPTNTCGLAACPDLLVLRVAGFSGGGRPR